MMTRWALVKRFKGVWDIVKTKDGAWVLFEDHEKNAVAQRQIVDEQVEENRGLRNDVLLMQKEDTSQRTLIEQQAGRLEELRQENYTLRQNSRTMSDAFHKDVTRMKDLNERLKIEAQGHAQEAKTANATIAEIYQCVSQSTGEVGNWHGAQPVRDAMDKQAREIAFHVSRVEALRRFLSEKITECQKQAEEIARITELAKGYHDTAENQKNDSEQQANKIARLTGIVHLLTTGECGSFIKTRFPFTFQQALKEEHS